MSLRLVALDLDNIDAACALTLRPGQEHYVEDVARSIAEAYVQGEVAWPRVVCDGDEVVAFVMAFLDIEWDPDTMPGVRRSGLWRLNVGADHQAAGVGRFAVAAVGDEIRRRGLAEHAYVTWESGVHGPEGFYLALGFEILDEDAGAQRVGRLEL